MLTEDKVTDFFVIVEKSVTFLFGFLFKSAAEKVEKSEIECFEEKDWEKDKKRRDE